MTETYNLKNIALLFLNHNIINNYVCFVFFFLIIFFPTHFLKKKVLTDNNLFQTKFVKKTKENKSGDHSRYI